MRFIVNQRRNHVGARTDQMNKRQKTAQYRRYIDFGELLKLDNNRLDKKTLHKQRKDSRYDREEDGLPFERPDGHQIRSCKTFLVESMLDVGDVLSSVAGRS